MLHIPKNYETSSLLIYTLFYVIGQILLMIAIISDTPFFGYQGYYLLKLIKNDPHFKGCLILFVNVLLFHDLD